jgi:hypothetical protein
LERYHRTVVGAHRNHTKLAVALPAPTGEQAAAKPAAAAADTSIWRRPEPPPGSWPVAPAPISFPTGTGSAPTPEDNGKPSPPESPNGPAPQPGSAQP